MGVIYKSVDGVDWSYGYASTLTFLEQLESCALCREFFDPVVN